MNVFVHFLGEKIFFLQFMLFFVIKGPSDLHPLMFYLFKEFVFTILKLKSKFENANILKSEFSEYCEITT